MFEWFKKIVDKIVTPIKEYFNTEYYTLEDFTREFANEEFEVMKQEEERKSNCRILLNKLETRLETINLFQLTSKFKEYQDLLKIYPRLITYKNEKTDIMVLNKEDYDLLVNMLKVYLHES